MVALDQPDVGTEPVFVEPDASIAKLEARLERGLAVIAERDAAGLPVERLEEYWITLLHTYERHFDSQH